MNYIVVNSICCCLNLCCKETWETLYKLLGKTSFIKIAYCLVYFAVIGVSIIAVNLLESVPLVLGKIASGINCDSYLQDEGLSCLTASTIYRVSFCLFIFSIFMLICLKICSARVGLILNEGLFFSKFVIIMVMVLISLNLDDKYFTGYEVISSIFSYTFALVQAIILVDLAYLWGIKWARHYSQGNNNYAILLIGSSIIFFILTIYFLVESFRVDNGMQAYKYLCVFQVLFMVGVQLLNFNQQNSLLTSSLLCLLVSYYSWTANLSHPNLSEISNDLFYLQIAVSFILMMICTGGSIYGSTNQQQEEENFIQLDENMNRPQLNQLHENREKQIEVWTHWLLYLSGLSVYSCMIITDWGSTDIIKNQFNLTTNAWLSKIIMGISLTVVYTWTLLAPKLCPHRNFYFE